MCSAMMLNIDPVCWLLVIFCGLHPSLGKVRLYGGFGTSYEISTNGGVVVRCDTPSNVAVEWLYNDVVVGTTQPGYEASPPVKLADENFNFLRMDSRAIGKGGKLVCRNEADFAEKDTTDVVVKTDGEALELSRSNSTDVASSDGIKLVCSSGKSYINIVWYLNGVALNAGAKQMGDLSVVKNPEHYEYHLTLDYEEAKRETDSTAFSAALKDRTYTFFCREKTTPRKFLESNHISVSGGSSASSASILFVLVAIVLQAAVRKI